MQKTVWCYGCGTLIDAECAMWDEIEGKKEAICVHCAYNIYDLIDSEELDEALATKGDGFVYVKLPDGEERVIARCRDCHVVGIEGIAIVEYRTDYDIAMCDECWEDIFITHEESAEDG